MSDQNVPLWKNRVFELIPSYGLVPILDFGPFLVLRLGGIEKCVVSLLMKGGSQERERGERERVK